MTVALIAAVAENGVIGQGNRLPWHIPEDLRNFKRLTLGKTLVMGRKTYQSIGGPLPGRRLIVVTSDPDWRAAGVTSAPSLSAALRQTDSAEVMVIGGAALFAEALPLSARLYLTEIHRAYDGDVRFPDWDRSAWRETERRACDGDPPFSFVVLER